jgi:hypothetical protein
MKVEREEERKRAADVVRERARAEKLAFEERE